jgi:hypothetical protein
MGRRRRNGRTSEDERVGKGARSMREDVERNVEVDYWWGGCTI